MSVQSVEGLVALRGEKGAQSKVSVQDVGHHLMRMLMEVTGTVSTADSYAITWRGYEVNRKSIT